MQYPSDILAVVLISLNGPITVVLHAAATDVVVCDILSFLTLFPVVAGQLTLILIATCQYLTV